jgi:hypothetical protein
MTDIEKTIEEAKAVILPFESWERLTGESSAAYGAFCAYRDYGPDRNIRKAAEAAAAGKDGEAGTNRSKGGKRYGMWRAWSTQFRWRERAVDYDRYLDRLKQTEKRKTIEAQEEMHRAVTEKMLVVVSKKLDLMMINPEELTQGTVKEWVETAVRTDREAAGLDMAKGGRTEPKQGEINFTAEFNGL